ncbi:anthranilate synthase component I family protein [Blattabacterium sp. (Cryptocercus kyebangensis)]|uniref:anthranilate synthase component I family protein n=1 Tax=Blattabacterium sp. (Cryptocercus kyebangensis) TaxID=298656 RepID=UPI000D7C633A|nr:anthranilate synthase component I family protein [Blattabacterium sp. (Cryptocercus kyebangensis)]AWU43816.1 anthranilate synthase component I family protein [Blattabacterium sp. (Cryptocercus kyebangensis)]
MFKFNFRTIQKKILSDSTTPIELYLKLRDFFPKILLLENYNNKIQKKYSSILCINPISELFLDKNVVHILYPNFVHKQIIINDRLNIPVLIDDFFKKFKSENHSIYYSGFYGYISYDSIQYFENIQFYSPIKDSYNLPKIRFGFYGNLIVFHPFCNEIYLIEHQFPNVKNISIDQLIELVNKKKNSFFPFKSIGNYSSNITDNEYKKMVSKGIKYCLRGDVFQIVLSRQFQQKFKGDEFNVYRSLRFINPSPYLFYFDYGNYKLFGSSPESQLVVNDQIAYINPIAGTIRKSENENENKKLYEYLINNPKENAEHIMLVDLARNDLSKNSFDVKVEYLKKIQEFSHVLHMVSKVSGKIKNNISIIKVFVDSFPAGTLSGAPKYKAMELIDKIENQHRGVYGGAIGFFGLDNLSINTAIIIRSFISKNNTLFFQAGAGVVSYSKEKKELEEVNNKLMALFKSIRLAENIILNKGL